MIGGKTICNWSDLAPKSPLNDTIIHAVDEKENLSKSIRHASVNMTEQLEPFWEGSQKVLIPLSAVKNEPPNA